MLPEHSQDLFLVLGKDRKPSPRLQPSASSEPPCPLFSSKPSRFGAGHTGLLLLGPALPRHCLPLATPEHIQMLEGKRRMSQKLKKQKAC